MVHYIRRDAPLYFTTSAYPGLFHLVGFSCAWARAYYYFLVQSVTRCFYTPALSLRLIRLIFGGPASSTSATAPPALSRNSALTLPPLPLRWPTPQGISRTTHIQNRPTPSSRTTSNLQAPRPPAPLGLDSPLDIVWLLFWLHRQHDAVSVV